MSKEHIRVSEKLADKCLFMSIPVQSEGIVRIKARRDFSIEWDVPIELVGKEDWERWVEFYSSPKYDGTSMNNDVPPIPILCLFGLAFSGVGGFLTFLPLLGLGAESNTLTVK